MNTTRVSQERGMTTFFVIVMCILFVLIIAAFVAVNKYVVNTVYDTPHHGDTSQDSY